MRPVGHAEVEAIKNEKPLYNQQHHSAPVEPPIMHRLAAARRHGEIPGDGAGINTRIDEALAVLRQDRADTPRHRSQGHSAGPLWSWRGSLDALCSGHPPAFLSPFPAGGADVAAGSWIIRRALA